MIKLETLNMRAVIALAAVLALATATVFFEEKFGDGWEDRWVTSEAKSDYGAFKVSAGKFYNDAEEDKGKLNANACAVAV